MDDLPGDIILIPMTATEFIALNKDYENTILNWILKEQKTSKENPKYFLELLVMNTKLLAADTKDGRLMREFLFNEDAVQKHTTQSTSMLINRVFDLLAYINTNFPAEFMQWKREQYVNTITEILGTTKLLDEYITISCLISHIQFVHNYLS